MKHAQAIGCGDSRYTVGCWVRQHRLSEWPTAKIPGPSSQSTIHNPQSTPTSWAHAVQAQQQRWNLESQHLASAVRPLLQHFQSSTPAHWAAGEFALDPGFGWGILRGEGLGESKVRKRAARAVLTAHYSLLTEAARSK